MSSCAGFRATVLGSQFPAAGTTRTSPTGIHPSPSPTFSRRDPPRENYSKNFKNFVDVKSQVFAAFFNKIFQKAIQTAPSKMQIFQIEDVAESKLNLCVENQSQGYA